VMPRRSSLLVPLALLIAALVASGCSGDDDGAAADATVARGAVLAETANLAIYDAFIPVPATDIGALYFEMVDTDGGGDRLLGVTTTVAVMTHFHSTVIDGDTSRMLPVAGGIVLPPDGATKLAPGGLHVMLMNLVTPLTAGDTVQVTLQFERAGAVTIEVPVLRYEDTGILGGSGAGS